MSLTLSYDEIRREVGRFIGIGTDSSAWSADDTTNVADAIRRGSRYFYYPDATMLPAERTDLIGHQWSFLQSSLSVSITAGVSFFDLPADFIRIAERPSIDGSDFPLVEIAEADLRDLVNVGIGSGPPQYYSITRNTTASPLAYQIGVYPKPTIAMTLVGRYTFLPDEISSSQEPIVPANHSETFLAAILAAADLIFNYESGTDGKHEERFKRLLVSSIMADQYIGGE